MAYLTVDMKFWLNIGYVYKRISLRVILISIVFHCQVFCKAGPIGWWVTQINISEIGIIIVIKTETANKRTLFVAVICPAVPLCTNRRQPTIWQFSPPLCGGQMNTYPALGLPVSLQNAGLSESTKSSSKERLGRRPMLSSWLLISSSAKSV